MVVTDKDDNYAMLFVYEWGIQRLLGGNKGLKLFEISNTGQN
jgi:hypothetical protein